MKLLNMLLLLLGVTFAASEFPQWHPPQQGDVRSPCPFLNSLANHGMIAHNGKDIDAKGLVEVLVSSLNISSDIATTISLGALQTSSNPASGKFNLDDLAKHNIIEHDGSLSRRDLFEGDNHSFCQKTFDEFLSYVNDTEKVTIAGAAAGRWRRMQASKAKNPSFTYSPMNRLNSYSESASYFELLKNATTQSVPMKFVKIFFEQERLPFEEGWRPTNRMNAFAFASDILQLALHTPEEAVPVGGTHGFHGFVSL